jgi:predicted 3-demethylubiquinone-9 3-methyltransferase (glyoxalase superfamily)
MRVEKCRLALTSWQKMLITIERNIPMSKLTPFLWFGNDAEEAANLYTSVFPDAKIVEKNYFPEGTPMADVLVTATVNLFGSDVVLLNGRPDNIKANESFSFMVDCETQAEIDSYWDQLIAGGGEPSQCGWLKDKFGVSWQITPAKLIELINDEDRDAAARAVNAMMGMQKLDIAELEKAHAG